MVQKYNKAIRDRIPETIKSAGKEFKIRKLTDEEFLVEIEKKLFEEVVEYKESKSIEELADILEVVFRIAELRGVSRQELETIRLKKKLNRGGFSKNLLLIETTCAREDGGGHYARI